MSLYNFLEQHGQYVLVGREQYEVLLDDRENPTEMWCDVLFSLDSVITVDGGMPPYVIVQAQKLGMGLTKYKLRKRT